MGTESLVESWKTVSGWDLYEISNLGRLRGKDRIIYRKNGSYLRKARILTPGKDRLGYESFILKQDGKKKHVKIHRLVAEAFIPNPMNKPCINHIDNNPSNNIVTNLEWCTMKENTAWMIKQGRFNRTEQWLSRLHRSQKPYYRAVVGTNIETGERFIFERLNAVRDAGFQPSCVCVCCKGKNGVTQHRGYRWEYLDEKHSN